MNKSNFLILLMMLLPICKLCFAQGGNTYNGRVTFYNYPSTTKVVNPFTLYGKTIKYYIMPGSQTMTLTSGNNTYTIDIAEVTREAMNEWQIALQQKIVFESISNEISADLRIRVSAKSLGELGSAHPKDTSGKARLKYSEPGFTRLLSNEFITYARKYMGNNASITDILRFEAKYVAKHELGHVLGFDHPNLLEATESNLMVPIIILADYPTPNMPIMYPDTGYMRNLYEYLGRIVTSDDITISVQESAALDSLLQATQHGCSCCVVSYVQPNDWLTSSLTGTNSNYSCPNFENNFVKVLQYLQISAVNHLYALDGVLPGIMQVIPVEHGSQNKVIIKPYYIALPKEL